MSRLSGMRNMVRGVQRALFKQLRSCRQSYGRTSDNLLPKHRATHGIVQ